MLTDIFAHLDQVVAVAHLQDLFGLRLVDGPGVSAVLGKGPGHVAKGQAGLHGGVELAGDAQVVVLVAAETGSDADEIGLLNDVGGPLVIQDVVGLFCHENGLVDKDPAQLGVHAQEEVLDEVLFDIDVLIEELAQILLVDVAPGPHEGKLKKTDHGGWQDELADAAVVGIDQQALFAEPVQQFFGLCLCRAPELGGLFQRKGTDRQFCHPFGFLFREEDLQDLREGLRGRSPLGEPVEPVLQIFISIS